MHLIQSCGEIYLSKIKQIHQKQIEKFIANLEDLKNAIENEDGKKLEEIFIKTKRIRKEIIKAGQDVSKSRLRKVNYFSSILNKGKSSFAYFCHDFTEFL